MQLLKSIEHAVLVQKTDRDPEIQSAGPLEPAGCKKSDFDSVG